mgnify:CR=1 FL=1
MANVEEINKIEYIIRRKYQNLCEIFEKMNNAKNVPSKFKAELKNFLDEARSLRKIIARYNKWRGLEWFDVNGEKAGLRDVIKFFDEVRNELAYKGDLELEYITYIGELYIDKLEKGEKGLIGPGTVLVRGEGLEEKEEDLTTHPSVKASGVLTEYYFPPKVKREKLPKKFFDVPMICNTVTDYCEFYLSYLYAISEKAIESLEKLKKGLIEEKRKIRTEQS